MNDIASIMENSPEIADFDKVFKELEYVKKHGEIPGLTTGWRQFDKYFMLPPFGQLNIVTGTPGSGKSEWLDSLAMNMAIKHKWKVYIYSPENNPLSYHMKKMVEKFSGKPFSGEYNGFPNVSKDDLDETKELMKSQFTIADCQVKGSTVESIINGIILQAVTTGCDMAIIDPWNKIETAVPPGTTETKYIGRCLAKLQMVAREKNISIWIVAHPAKMKKNRDGQYANVTLYDISDSSNWYNMSDNGFILERSWSDKIGTDFRTLIRIAKIKDRRYGKCGEHEFIFDPRSGRYIEPINGNREQPTQRLP